MNRPPLDRRLLQSGLVFLAALLLALLSQWWSGAWRAEFGGHPDEAAHVVTGLMVRDYVAAGFPGSPLAFAEKYYAHYPKIGLGVWPPFFYAVQACWTLIAPAERLSLLILMACLAATLALIVHHALRDETGPISSALGGLLAISLPVVGEYFGMVMAETLSAVLMLGATVAFGAFLRSKRLPHSLLFGALAGLAIMTKGTGLALALMVPLAIAISGEWAVLRRPSLWGGALVTALIAGAWTWKFRSLGAGGWEQPSPSLAWSLSAMQYYLGKLALSLGTVVIALATLGLWRRLFAERPAHRSKWAALAALILAVAVFQSLVPAGREARHLIPALPAAILFAVAGAAWLADSLLRPRLPMLRSAALPLLLVLTLLLSAFPRKPKVSAGFSSLASQVVSENAGAASAVLVSSDATGEGMFIAEVALRDRQRPSFTIQRASKAVAASEWSGRSYQSFFATDNELQKYLASGPYRRLLVDESIIPMKRRPHHDALARVGAQFPLISETTVTRAPGFSAPARFYRLAP